ncbi:hypothetical protein LB503_013039 [Fusarium chuoi]|nr:hypothetical protein LB503_013039 [Fusarium chuoi]
MNFPLDATSFETLYPNASLTSLNTFDPLLYKVCSSFRVLIRLLIYREANRNRDSGLLERCSDFDQFALSRFWTIFIETQMLCQTLIDQLTGAGESSLQGIVNTLTNKTYSQPDSENNPEFKSLAQSASEMLVNLSQVVNQRTSSIQGLAGTISAVSGPI